MKAGEMRTEKLKVILSQCLMSMSEDIEFMIKRFPMHKDKILNESKSNDEFKTLCEDFYACALMLQNQKKKIIKNKTSELEYRKLFLDLEDELANFLTVKND
jgi:hypothetical protein